MKIERFWLTNNGRKCSIIRSFKNFWIKLFFLRLIIELCNFFKYSFFLISSFIIIYQYITKEMTLCHKWKFSYSYTGATWWCKPLPFKKGLENQSLWLRLNSLGQLSSKMNKKFLRKFQIKALKKIMIFYLTLVLSTELTSGFMNPNTLRIRSISGFMC